MRNYFLLLLINFSVLGFAQETYYVTAPSGLIVRNEPNGKRFGKISYGSSVEVTKKMAPFSVTDNDKVVNGNWVKIKGGSFQIEYDENISFSIDSDKIYAFNGFLTPKNEFINQKEKIISNHPALKNYYLATSYDVFAIKGDFFGDGIEDDLFRMIDPKGKVRLMIINHQQNGSKVYGLGGEKDPFELEDYDFTILRKVPKGTPLWCNYTDEFRDFNEVPKNEIVKLNYDAIFVHEAEACGGGFIFWKNNKWNWLQQE